METKVKEQLIRSVKAIKNKIKEMQNDEVENEIKYNKIFKPITEPLKAIDAAFNKENSKVSNLKQNDIQNPEIEMPSTYHKDIENDAGDFDDDDLYETDSSEHSTSKEDSTFFIPNKFETKNAKLSTPVRSWINVGNLCENPNTLQVPFGLRNENEKLMVGNSEVRFSKIGPTDDEISLATIGGKKYEITAGIKEVLLKSKPNLDLVTEKDKLVYKDILITTNAHKRDYNPHGQIKGDRGMKYNLLIKPLFLDVEQNEGINSIKKTGGTLPVMKKYRKNTDFIYWDDPNELIERLKLLVASRDAGNNSHDNEIISIIEELKEAGIIKE